MIKMKKSNVDRIEVNKEEELRVEIDLLNVLDARIKELGLTYYGAGLRMLNAGKSTHLNSFTNLSNFVRKEGRTPNFRTLVNMVEVLGGKVLVRWD
jgi:hypothetical protein